MLNELREKRNNFIKQMSNENINKGKIKKIAFKENEVMSYRPKQ
jgi:hypothetical protein